MTTGAVEVDLDDALARYRRELTAYCYRMLGSAADAEDAVQDTMLRAWRGFEQFEGRAALRAWLYRIATNVCLDLLAGRARRALPMDLGPAADRPVPLGEPLAADRWVGPIPDLMIDAVETDPAEVVTSHESIRVAFIHALQHLLPRQRAVLILRDVLRWKASEVADLLDVSVEAVNSTLRRARAALAATNLSPAASPAAPVEEALLARYADAFERLDMDTLVAMLREDATISMPPFRLWLDGQEAFSRFFPALAADCANTRFVTVHANGSPAFAVYKADEPNGEYRPFCVHVLELADRQICNIYIFLEPDLFEIFGLPDVLE
jgi:RNA polymerase sigma-70 factor (ECF subfamily)